jgi:hypothetical protein
MVLDMLILDVTFRKFGLAHELGEETDELSY